MSSYTPTQCATCSIPNIVIYRTTCCSTPCCIHCNNLFDFVSAHCNTCLRREPAWTGISASSADCLFLSASPVQDQDDGAHLRSKKRKSRTPNKQINLPAPVGYVPPHINLPGDYIPTVASIIPPVSSTPVVKEEETKPVIVSNPFEKLLQKAEEERIEFETRYLLQKSLEEEEERQALCEIPAPKKVRIVIDLDDF